MGKAKMKEKPMQSSFQRTYHEKDLKDLYPVLKGGRHFFIIPIVFSIVFTIYAASLYPSLPGGDSGELVVAAHETGVAHPPGYPIYTVLSKLFVKLCPFGSVAWRLNLLTALLGSIAAVVLYDIVFKLTQENGPALVGAGFFAFSRLTWYWSVSAEVFALNNFLLSLLMLKAIDLCNSPKEDKHKVLLIGSFLCGLCLSNQHTSALFIVFLVPWALLHTFNCKVLSLRIVALVACTFLLGLLPYAYLPISAHAQRARWTWGDQRSVMGFVKHLLRQEYGTWDLLKDHSGQGFLEGLKAYSSHVSKDLSWVIAVMAIGSPAAVVFRRKTKVGGLLLVFSSMLIFYVSFFAWRANLDIKKPLFFRVVERFWMQADLVIIIFAALSYNDLSKFVCKYLGYRRFYLDVVLVLPLIAIHASKSWQHCNQRNNTIIRDFSLQALHAFPNNSIILTKGDLCSNGFRYFHFCENVRTDLHVFDQEVLTYDWSLPMMRKFYPGITFPGDLFHLHSGVRKDGRKAFTFKDLIDANIKSHPIFACIGVQEHEPSWQESYTLRPFGVCWQLAKKDASLNLNKLSKEAAAFTENWTYKWTHEPDDGSWEYVANSEMWRAKTALPLFLLETSLSLPDGDEMSTSLLLKSYELYTEAIEVAAAYPAFWHRNYAITCERLLRVKTSFSQLDLVKKVVLHFKEFIRLEPGDADAVKIKEAIKTLSDYIKNTDPDFR